MIGTVIITLFVLASFVLALVTLYLIWLKKSEKERYNEDMEFLEPCIKNWIVNDNNYRIITELFEDVWRNNKDPLRTSKAYSRFKRKYKEFYPENRLKELINQN